MLGRLTLERQPWCGGKSQDTTYRYVTGAVSYTHLGLEPVLPA